MDQMEKIKEMKKITEKLLNLLNNPEPGLFTWQTMLHDCMKKLQYMWMYF